MNIISFIPIRIGSKGIKHKNIKELNGKPLAQWSIDESNNSKYIDRTIASIDSKLTEEKIKNCDIFWRDDQTATDTATSESALIEFCETQKPDDLIVFIQATSPLIKSDEIDKGILRIINGECDSIVSVVRQYRFTWSDEGIPSYDINNRPRRQDHSGFLVENGAFYISKVEDIIKSKCRVSGRIGLIECSEESYFEIDEEHDWFIVDKLLKNRNDNIR